MFYFIPAWYNADRKWSRTSVPFYFSTPNMHFDDTINLLRMFQQSGEKATLVLLNYEPQIRSFLYQQQVDSSCLWSLFDDIQGVGDAVTHKIRLTDIEWPAEAELFHTPFLLQVNVAGEVYARVEFTSMGDLFEITYFSNKERTLQCFFDDRGFVSSVIRFENGIALEQDYLNTHGEVVLTESLVPEDPIVLVAPAYYKYFDRPEYNSIEDVIREKFAAKMQAIEGKKDAFVVSSSHQHNNLIAPLKSKAHVVYSFFGEHDFFADTQRLSEQLTGTPFFVVDSVGKLSQIPEDVLKSGALPPFYEIPPYDTKLTLGHSQRKKELIVYLNADTLPEHLFDTVVGELLQLMEDNEWMDLMIGAKGRPYSNRKEELRNRVEALQERLGHSFTFIGDKPVVADIVIGEPVEPPRQRIALEEFHRESELEEALRYVRLIVDLGHPADILTQITGISTGIPQVNLLESSYVKHGQNGWILTDIAELSTAVHYYLSDLTHWNESLVHSVKVLELYTNGSIVEMWKNTIKEQN